MNLRRSHGKRLGVVRSGRAYLAGFGTTGSLLAGAALMFIVASALVAFRGWPHVAMQPTPAQVVVSPQRTASASGATLATRRLAFAAAAPAGGAGGAAGAPRGLGRGPRARGRAWTAAAASDRRARQHVRSRGHGGRCSLDWFPTGLDVGAGSLAHTGSAGEADARRGDEHAWERRVEHG